jgi:hypothetical protein
MGDGRGPKLTVLTLTAEERDVLQGWARRASGAITPRSVEPSIVNVVELPIRRWKSRVASDGAGGY